MSRKPFCSICSFASEMFIIKVILFNNTYLYKKPITITGVDFGITNLSPLGKVNLSRCIHRQFTGFSTA